MTKAICLSLVVCSLGLSVAAHTVTWYENWFGFGGPLVFSDTGARYIDIMPSAFEDCIVAVNLDTQPSPYIATEFVPFAPFSSVNPANWVRIKVSLKNLPPGTNTITTSISGEWHATGFPTGQGCDATNANRFTVPVTISLQRSQWAVGLINGGNDISIDTRKTMTLQCSDCVWGPWQNLGIGSKFVVMPMGDTKFFQGDQRIGGPLIGVVFDNSGKPQSGIQVGLPLGGASAVSAADGGYSVNLPWGDNQLSFTKSITFIDPGTGSNRTETAGVETVVPGTNSYTEAQLKVDVQIIPPATNCTCSPWCAIGFGTLNGIQTPIYFSGGANPPKGAPANCGQVQVTVTPPTGAPFSIKPGSGRGQNSGPNPALGTWTVTTTVCGQSKSCAVSVP